MRTTSTPVRQRDTGFVLAPRQKGPGRGQVSARCARAGAAAVGGGAHDGATAGRAVCRRRMQAHGRRGRFTWQGRAKPQRRRGGQPRLQRVSTSRTLPEDGCQSTGPTRTRGSARRAVCTAGPWAGRRQMPLTASRARPVPRELSISAARSSRERRALRSTLYVGPQLAAAAPGTDITRLSECCRGSARGSWTAGAWPSAHGGVAFPSPTPLRLPRSFPQRYFLPFL